MTIGGTRLYNHAKETSFYFLGGRETVVDSGQAPLNLVGGAVPFRIYGDGAEVMSC